MKFEIDDKTGMMGYADDIFYSISGKKLSSKHNGIITCVDLEEPFNESSVIKDSIQTIEDPITLKTLEQILQAVKKTQEKLGGKPNYEKSDEYEEVPVIIYDGVNGFMIQDIRLVQDPYEIHQRLRVPSPEEVEKFIKHANIAYKKSINKQIQKIQDSKNNYVVDVKCQCGHWGNEHSLFDSDHKKHCRSCECNNYEPKFNHEKIEQNQKIVDEIIKSIQAHQRHYDCEGCNEEASDTINIIEKIKGKDIKDL